MPYSEKLAERITALLKPNKGLVIKKCSAEFVICLKTE